MFPCLGVPKKLKVDLTWQWYVPPIDLLHPNDVQHFNLNCIANYLLIWESMHLTFINENPDLQKGSWTVWNGRAVKQYDLPKSYKYSVTYQIIASYFFSDSICR